MCIFSGELFSPINKLRNGEKTVTDRDGFAGLIVGLLISLAVSVLLGMVLLALGAAATLSLKDPLSAVKPLAYAALGIASVAGGAAAAKLNRRSEVPRGFLGAAAGALLSLLLLGAGLLPCGTADVAGNAGCSVGERVIVLLTTVALSATGSLFCREKKHAHYRKARRRRR